MTPNDLMAIVSSLGFPIVMCGGLMWYIKYLTDNNTTEMGKMREEHQKEVSNMVETVNNNTLAIQKLITIIEERM